jgi:hypothetical protein
MNVALLYYKPSMAFPFSSTIPQEAWNQMWFMHW